MLSQVWLKFAVPINIALTASQAVGTQTNNIHTSSTKRTQWVASRSTERTISCWFPCHLREPRNVISVTDRVILGKCMTPDQSANQHGRRAVREHIAPRATYVSVRQAKRNLMDHYAKDSARNLASRVGVKKNTPGVPSETRPSVRKQSRRHSV